MAWLGLPSGSVDQLQGFLTRAVTGDSDPEVLIEFCQLRGQYSCEVPNGCTLIDYNSIASYGYPRQTALQLVAQQPAAPESATVAPLFDFDKYSKYSIGLAANGVAIKNYREEMHASEVAMKKAAGCKKVKRLVAPKTTAFKKSTIGYKPGQVTSNFSQ
ncbi:hypothetical protein VOLCADRAFT_96927 [Volvox carteri f. nagariensis]|uniref:Uncharacterized protein n=1 Tax=Volvox carteri f. nagariensis TaxID=3068 RepID=D8UBC7_VOLCA|nr:uncharacterized protein VOLCADRAFT_96927 [Volvox carteri f. nagariensis]EFJ42926.1 hypothetical protein VOLCADRAFT_96927 [Volvox carteri f. nagariensis]|eukprot:XP_002955966.1 hypothetical protein VOLCADRAFT_96927 [Volvox carteri f. nagariensis]